MINRIITLLILLALSSNAAGEQSRPLSDYFLLDRGEIPFDRYHCLTDEEIKLIADEIKNSGKYLFELQKYREFGENNYRKQDSIEFYQDPMVIIGGVAISITLGIMIGYYLGR